MSYVKPVKDITFEPTRTGFLFALSRRESSSDLRSPDNISPNIDAQRVHNRGTAGYIGYFQFGEAALYDAGYFTVSHAFSNKTDSAFQKALVVQDWIGSWTGKDGVTSKAIFLNGRRHQWNAINTMVNRHCSALRGRNVNEFYGKIVNGVEITESGCIAGCHLKGAKHVLDFVRGAANAADAFGTKVGEYINLLAHYDLESCCNRKIYINVVRDGQPVSNYDVNVESEYKEGRYFNEIGVIKNKYKTDENGKTPVITRHPDAKIKITIDGKSMEVVQEANRKQNYTIDLTGNISVKAALEKPSTPQPLPQTNQTPQDARNKQNAEQTSQQIAVVNEEVRFAIQIVEGDSGNAISNLRFYLTYKGNIKEHRSDSSGIKQGIVAESGQDIEVAVASNGTHQVISHFTVQASLSGQTMKVVLPVHSFRLKIINESRQVVKNSTFMVFYRGRQIKKKTDAQGIIPLRMLTGFVYGFGLINGKEMVKVRCVKSIGEQTLRINEAAQKASALLEQLSVAKPVSQPPSPVTQPKSPTNPTTPPETTKEAPKTQQNNTHTQATGNPVTTVNTSAPPSSDTTRYHIYHDGKIKRQNKSATGFAEFIYYDQNGGEHNLGKSAFVVGSKYELVRDSKGKVVGNKKVSGSSYLIDQSKHKSYRKENTGYTWKINSSDKRYYLSGLSLGSVLGAMCSLGYGEYTGSGFSTIDGGSGESNTHINGINGDFRYLGINNIHMTTQVYTNNSEQGRRFDWDANVKFVNALNKFGYKSFLSRPVYIKNGAMLPYSTSVSNHHHHIHLQGYSPNVEDI